MSTPAEDVPLADIRDAVHEAFLSGSDVEEWTVPVGDDSFALIDRAAGGAWLITVQLAKFTVAAPTEETTT